MTRKPVSLPAGVSPAVLDRLQGVRGFVFDMDGTLTLGNRSNIGHAPLPGALEFTRRLTERGIPYLIFTNGTALTPAQYAEQLSEIGFKVSPHLMMTPAASAADLFVRRGYKRIMVFGGEGMCRPLIEAGLEVVPPAGKVQVDAVFCGWHREITMDSIESACHAVWGGARMYAASVTKFFATAEGKGLAPPRAISTLIRDFTGCRITTTGKPSLDALRCAAQRLGVKLKDLAVVGDDPELEVAMAHRGGSLAVAVRTGLGSSDAYGRLAEGRRPHLHVDHVGTLLELCA